ARRWSGCSRPRAPSTANGGSASRCSAPRRRRSRASAPDEQEISSMDVIQYQDPTGSTMVSRWPASGTSAIRLGSQLIVEESQQAVFFRDGKALDTFGPGRHTLATQNVPILASLFGIPFGGTSPFQAAVFFVSTKTFLDLKWGTKEPVVFRDQDLSMVRLRAFGKFAVRVANAQLFVNSVVGSRGLYTTAGVEDYFRDAIVARLTDVLGENLTSIFDLPKLYDELAMGLKSRVADDFTKYGIELVDLYLGAITPPEEVQKLIDERTGMGAIGNMDSYLKFKTARGIGDAAQQPGGTMGAGVGLGMGAGVGMMLPQMMQQAMQQGQRQPGPTQPGQAQQGGPAPGSPAPAAGGAAAGAAAAGGTPAFCFNCGQKLPSGAKFCPACGTAI